MDHPRKQDEYAKSNKEETSNIYCIASLFTSTSIFAVILLEASNLNIQMYILSNSTTKPEMSKKDKTKCELHFYKKTTVNPTSAIVSNN